MLVVKAEEFVTAAVTSAEGSESEAEVLNKNVAKLFKTLKAAQHVLLCTARKLLRTSTRWNLSWAQAKASTSRWKTALVRLPTEVS